MGEEKIRVKDDRYYLFADKKQLNAEPKRGCDG